MVPYYLSTPLLYPIIWVSLYGTLLSEYPFMVPYYLSPSRATKWKAQKSWFSSSQGQRLTGSPNCPEQLVCIPILYSMGMLFFLWVKKKRPECPADLLSPFTFEVKNMWSHTSAPPMPSWYSLPSSFLSGPHVTWRHNSHMPSRFGIRPRVMKKNCLLFSGKEESFWTLYKRISGKGQRGGQLHKSILRQKCHFRNKVCQKEKKNS